VKIDEILLTLQVYAGHLILWSMAIGFHQHALLKVITVGMAPASCSVTFLTKLLVHQHWFVMLTQASGVFFLETAKVLFMCCFP